jgi:hypothetical protein
LLNIAARRYTDQTSGNITLSNNTIFNTSDACYHNHEGNAIMVVNNVLTKQSSTHGDGMIKSAAPDAAKHWTASATFLRNVLFSAVAPFSPSAVFTDVDSKSPYTLSTFDSNLYWSTTATAAAAVGGHHALTFPGNQSFAAWQQSGAGPKGGEDAHSVVADPGFVDAAAFDFRLKSGSPALALGFLPIDTSSVGPRPRGAVHSE